MSCITSIYKIQHFPWGPFIFLVVKYIWRQSSQPRAVVDSSCLTPKSSRPRLYRPDLWCKFIDRQGVTSLDFRPLKSGLSKSWPPTSWPEIKTCDTLTINKFASEIRPLKSWPRTSSASRDLNPQLYLIE